MCAELQPLSSQRSKVILWGSCVGSSGVLRGQGVIHHDGSASDVLRNTIIIYYNSYIHALCLSELHTATDPGEGTSHTLQVRDNNMAVDVPWSSNIPHLPSEYEEEEENLYIPVQCT